tara:strand:+ start:227 stop:688 length:462 start_codon:yes stop_codon:yes gene_type:complete
MADSLSQLNTLTGCFPGATGAAVATALPAAHSDDYNNTDGYIAIPVNSIAYTGGVPNKVNVTDAGILASPSLTAGVGDGAGTCSGDFRKFARGLHESWARYTAETLTGNNSITFWGESSGNYVVFNANTLSKTYSTDLYYEVGLGLPSKTSTS